MSADGFFWIAIVAGAFAVTVLLLFVASLRGDDDDCDF